MSDEGFEAMRGDPGRRRGPAGGWQVPGLFGEAYRGREMRWEGVVAHSLLK